jgi:drug/metabolite transporter (DMT)-like permease
VTAIIGGLVAAVLWATATLSSSRSSRMLGSRVVIAWVMLVGAAVGLPLALLSPAPAEVQPEWIAVVLVSGACYVVGLQLTYAALRIGKVSLIAPIVATEGAVGAILAVALGDPLTATAAVLLGVIVLGVVLASLDRSGPDVPAGDLDVMVDSTEVEEVPAEEIARAAAERRAVILAIIAALVFGVGIVTAGRSALVLPVTWVAVTARAVGVVAVALPLILTGRLTLTRQALPLVVIAGVGEIVGSMASAWGSRESIAVTAVLGSQFAAIAAVAAYFLFHERLARIQVVGVVLIVVGVTALAATSI